MGDEQLRTIEIEYNANEIDEQEKIWDFLENQQKRGIIKRWRIVGKNEQTSDSLRE